VGGHVPEYSEGNVITEKLSKNGNSYYLLIPPDIIKYINLDPEKDLLVVKFEKGKWGHYIGVGKLVKQAKG
jgi:hypothetical protein